MSKVVDFTVVGAGIVGLSTAYKLHQAFPDAAIRVMDKENRVATHQTGNNSGVIHSGVYYKPGSFKAKNCVDGRHQLVDFCQTYDVKHDICGKIIVESAKDRADRLPAIFDRGVQNGIEGITVIDRKEMKEIEPEVEGTRAIHVPCAGIVDYVGFSRELERQLKDAGIEFCFGHKVDRIHSMGSAESPEIDVHAGNQVYKTKYLVNCAGLYSDVVARAAGIQTDLQIVPFRGEYYELKKSSEWLVNGLIYPLPNPEFPFLGVHFTKMVLGGVECGPNAVFAFKREGYHKLDLDIPEAVETLLFPGFWKMAAKHWKMGLDEMVRSASKGAFVKGLQGLVPAVQASDLKPAPAGVRAMALLPSGEILDDFYYERIPGQIHVLNAPSPAATACLAIADEIVSQAKEHFELEDVAAAV